MTAAPHRSGEESGGHHPLPFATATIARLYMLQGKLEQAEEIYRKLLEERPGDRRLLEGLAEVQQRLRARLEPLPGDDRLELDWQGTRLRCRWVVTPSGLRRAELTLGAPGSLVLRLLAFASSAPPASQDHSLPGSSGELELPAPEGALVLAAAVGLGGEGNRFAAIAHCCTATG